MTLRSPNIKHVQLDYRSFVKHMNAIYQTKTQRVTFHNPRGVSQHCVTALAMSARCQNRRAYQRSIWP